MIDTELLSEGKDPGREKIAADKTAKHANTPNVQHVDTLGRPVSSVEHNKNINTEADQYYHTIASFDSEGNLRSVTDDRGNVVLTTKPGLGMEFNWDYINDNLVKS